MTSFGFVIDPQSCTGCYAGTVECEQDYRVGLGAFHTWVKHIEQGSFPGTRRYFSMRRCHHRDALTSDPAWVGGAIASVVEPNEQPEPVESPR